MFCVSYTLFGAQEKINSFVFSKIQTLFTKHPGGVPPANQSSTINHFQTLSQQHISHIARTLECGGSPPLFRRQPAMPNDPRSRRYHRAFSFRVPHPAVDGAVWLVCCRDGRGVLRPLPNFSLRFRGDIASIYGRGWFCQFPECARPPVYRRSFREGSAESRASPALPAAAIHSCPVSDPR